MAPRPGWAWGAPPISAPVDCQGAGHRVTWRWGHLVLEDHDLGAEAVLEALGGEAAGCTAVLEAWRQAVAEDRDRIGFRKRDPDLPRELNRAVEAARLARRLRAWRAGKLDPPALHRLHRTLLDEVRASLAAAVRPAQGLPGGPRVSLDLHPLGPDGEPELEVDVGRARVEVRAFLAPTWLAEVAGRGLGQVPGAMVLEVLDIDRAGEAAWVTALRWPAEAGLSGAPVAAAVPLRRSPESRRWEIGPAGGSGGAAALVAPRAARPGIWTRVRTR